MLLLNLGCDAWSPVLSLGTLVSEDASVSTALPPLDAGTSITDAQVPRIDASTPETSPTEDLRIVRLWPAPETLTFNTTERVSVEVGYDGPTEISTWIRLSWIGETAPSSAEAAIWPLELRPGALEIIEVPISVPASLPTGRYRLQVEIDPDDVVEEIDESNNRQTVGSSSIGRVTVRPAPLDFGWIGVGCTAEQTVTLTNFGPEAIFVSSWSWDGPPTPFEGLLPLSTLISPSDTLETQIRYRPSSAGIDRQTIRLFAGAEDVSVTVSGRATQRPLRSETFTQWPGPRLDVLLILYDGPSMTDDQSFVLQGAADLVFGLRDQHADFRLAVTTADMTPSGARGAFISAPEILTPTDTDAGHRLSLSLRRPYDGALESRGLDALRQVLNAPPRDDFLRPDAGLFVVFVSDRDDASMDPVGIYRDEMQARLQNRAAAVSVVDVPNAPCPTAVEQGLRYADFAGQIRGETHSLCQFTWQQIAEFIERSEIGYRTRFSMSWPPIEDTVRVRVNGREIDDSAWQLDSMTRQIVFEPSAVPEPDAEIRIVYRSEC